MDPISITLIVVSAVSSFTAVVSFIGSKIHHKHKENKKIITKITEGDIIKKHDHSHKDKSKLKDKNKDNEELNKLKLEKMTNKSSVNDSKDELFDKTISRESNISSSSSSDGIITEVKFKQIYVEENLSSNKEGTITTFGGNIEFKPNSSALKALATGGIELLGKDLIDHNIS